MDILKIQVMSNVQIEQIHSIYGSKVYFGDMKDMHFPILSY